MEPDESFFWVEMLVRPSDGFILRESARYPRETRNTVVLGNIAHTKQTGHPAVVAELQRTLERDFGLAIRTVGSMSSTRVTPDASQFVINSTTQLTAGGYDVDGNYVYSGPFSWSSDNPSVATVSSTGLVTGVGIGSTTIRASSGGYSGSATVTVTSRPFQ